MAKNEQNPKKRGFIGGISAGAATAWLLLEAMKAVVYFFTFQFLKSQFKKKGEEGKDVEIFKDES